jgi:predicted DNA-binding ribbon-helix-helix protein
MPKNSEPKSDDKQGPTSRGASTLVNRNVFIGRHRTSIRLEPAMWDSLTEICRREDMSLHEICGLIDARRQASSLTAAIRVFALTYFRVAATEDGHARSGHGLLFSNHRRTRRTPAELSGAAYRQADSP